MGSSTLIKIMLEINKNFKEGIKGIIIINLRKRDFIHIKGDTIITKMAIRWVEDSLIMVDLGKDILVEDLVGEVLFTGLILPHLQVMGDSLIENNTKMIEIEIVIKEEEEEEENKEEIEENIVINNLRDKSKVSIIDQEKPN